MEEGKVTVVIVQLFVMKIVMVLVLVMVSVIGIVKASVMCNCQENETDIITSPSLSSHSLPFNVIISHNL